MHADHGSPQRRRRRWSARLPLAVFALLVAGDAAAQQREGRARPCREALRKACPDVEAGTPAFRACIHAHADDFSPECRERMKGLQDRIDRMREACKAEIEAHCGDTQVGRGRVARCLRSHRDELSEECSEAVPSPRGGGGPHRHGEGAKRGEGAPPEGEGAGPEQGAASP